MAFLLCFNGLPVHAFPDFYSDSEIQFFDPKACDPNDGGLSGGGSGSDGGACCPAGGSNIGAADGGFGIDQVKAFAGQSITSTWNISDSTAEEWFLKQAGARATVSKYGLNSSNIGAITSAVKAAGVSPVFFYAYTVSEGGNAGGFINHYVSDTGGGGTANARRDAEYLVSQSKVMDSKPAWVDAGNPVDFVPQNVKSAGEADFQKMPEGSIGRAYIPATAATAWEVYYPKGLKKEVNQVQDYGKPLADTMKNIKTMGGNPLDGGATISTAGSGCGGGTNGVTGEGMAKGISFAVAIANNDGYGYDQPGRETGWEKWKSDPDCTDKCGSFDCSSFISAIITVAEYTTTNPNFSTDNQASVLVGAGFEKIANSAPTSEDLQPGDILLAANHTALYIGNNKMVDASINENGEISGGKVGDQTGEEISVKPFKDKPWIGVFRASN